MQRGGVDPARQLSYRDVVRGLGGVGQLDATVEAKLVGWRKAGVSWAMPRNSNPWPAWARGRPVAAHAASRANVGGTSSYGPTWRMNPTRSGARIGFPIVKSTEVMIGRPESP